MNPKVLKKRPMSSYNSKGNTSPLGINTLINWQTKNNFMPTPMKGIFRGIHLEDYEINDEFRPILVIGEGAKIYP